MKAIVVLHDISGTNRLSDFIKTALAFKSNIKTIIVTRASGAAAQYGIPEASKILYKEGIPFILLPDLPDIEDLLAGKKLLQITNTYGETDLSPELLGGERQPVIVLSGSENGFSRKELLSSARKVRIPGVERELPPGGALAVALYIMSL